MADKLDTFVLDNGMVVLGEPMTGVESVAFDFMVPSGAARLPEGCCGAANVIEDWIFRGAGEWDSRALSDAMDGLGLHRSSAVGSSYITVGSALESSKLGAALELYGDVILRASLTDEEFEPARQLAMDGIKGLDDDPRQKVMLKLREQFYRQPLGRSTMGHIDELEDLTAVRARELVRGHFNMGRAIFTVAGKYDFAAARSQMEELCGEVEAKDGGDLVLGEKAGSYTHIPNDGAQVHIGLMTETVLAGDEDYYNVRVAVSVLSGSMSSRLFTEVREKRGLCYAVGAKYHGMKEMAGIACYAGTTPDKAQETIDVIRGEFGRLGEGISEEEIQRAKVGLKSALIMQSESSSARAGAIGSDWHVLGRVRSLDEIKERIEATSVESVVGFLRRKPFGEFTVVTIGPKEVKV